MQVHTLIANLLGDPEYSYMLSVIKPVAFNTALLIEGVKVAVKTDSGDRMKARNS